MASTPYSKMFDVEVVGGDQRTRLAEMLRANALNAPQGQMVSGWYVPPSWSQNLAQLANTAVGVFGGQALDQERKENTARLLRELSQGKEIEQEPVMQNFNRVEGVAEGQTPFPNQPAQTELQRAMGRQPIPVEGQTPAAQGMTQPRPAQPQFKPLTEEEKIGKVMELAQYNPYAAQIWSAQDTARQNRLMKLEDEKSRREWQAEQNQLNREGRLDYARLAAGLAASNRVAPEDKPLTEYQGQSVLYGTRAAQSNKVLENVSASPGEVEVTRRTGIVGNFFAPANVQQTVQAQRDFINAVLRRESGATISPSEFENAQKQYFPQPGDKPEVLAQKKANRELVISGFAEQAGPAGRKSVLQVYNAPYVSLSQQPEKESASRGRIGGLTPPNTQVKFLGFEK